jgi:hypothetical protein
MLLFSILCAEFLCEPEKKRRCRLLYGYGAPIQGSRKSTPFGQRLKALQRNPHLTSSSHLSGYMG